MEKISNHILMDKKELEKLSKSQLIELLLKQEKKPVPTPRRPIPTPRKKVSQIVQEYENKVIARPIPAPRKKVSQMVQEHENKVIARPVPAPRTKKSVIDKPVPAPRTKTKGEIIMYSKVHVSLNEFRMDEMKLTKSNKNASFRELFQRRLTEIKGHREKISITLYVDIQDGLIENKKSYGPFTVDVPRLDRRDMYKFMVYTLLSNNFTLLSAQEIKKIGCKIVTHNKQFFMHHFMEGLKLESYLLSKQRQIKSYGDNTCVLDYVWDQVKGKRGFKTYNYDKLKAELYSFAYKAPKNLH